MRTTNIKLLFYLSIINKRKLLKPKNNKMKTQLSTLLFILVFNSGAYTQFSLQYFQMIEEANSLYIQDKFLDAGHTFSKAFLESGDLVMSNDRYTAAASYALAGQADSAFVHLNFLANHGKDDSFTFKMEKDFEGLHSDSRWQTFINHLDSNHATINKGLNQELVCILDTVLYNDQYLRNKFEFVELKYGRDSEELKLIGDEQLKRDSTNVKIVSDLLSKNGWMGSDLIGNHTLTIFIVIQHANLEIQEKYLPLFQSARDEGELDPASVAMLEDRINVAKGLPQLYGSQLTVDENGQTVFAEIFEPEKVNERRLEVGLGPIEDYAFMFGIEWKVGK